MILVRHTATLSAAAVAALGHVHVALGTPAEAAAEATAGLLPSAPHRRLCSLALEACATDANFSAAIQLYEDASVAHRLSATAAAETAITASGLTPLLTGMLRGAVPTGKARGGTSDPLDGDVPHAGRYFSAAGDSQLAPVLPSEERFVVCCTLGCFCTPF